MVPVLSKNKQPLMPCSEKRARKLIEKGEAVKYWQKGIFCIKLLKIASSNNLQDIVIGIDPGSKREGYTIASKKTIIFNITTNTPNWVKAHVEDRKNNRRNRRRRKTPYRKMRLNRSSLKNKNRIAFSTKARWDAKLRIIKYLLAIMPITIINVEDIKAISKLGTSKWNTNFSQLEYGKTWFYDQIINLGLSLIKTQGFDTHNHRLKRGFSKTKNKLNYIWEAHNVDSHCLCEIAFNSNIVPFKGIWKIEFMEFYRRKLHELCPSKNGYRRPYGSTISMGMSRGAVLKYKNKLYYLGGSSKGKISLYSILTGKRFNQHVKKENTIFLFNNKRRVQYVPYALKAWKSTYEIG